MDVGSPSNTECCTGIHLTMTDDVNDECALSPDSKVSDNNIFDTPSSPKKRRLHGEDIGLLSSSFASPLISCDTSLAATPTDSPALPLCHNFKQQYKDELWKAIESNYKYLMDKEIIDACQFSGSIDDGEKGDVPGISFSEFLTQCQELSDWLSHAQHGTERSTNSLSEKHLNSICQEALLENSSRHDFLKKYAAQVLHSYPQLHDQVHSRLQLLNQQWLAVQTSIETSLADSCVKSIQQDLEHDLATLNHWLDTTESFLLSLNINSEWSQNELKSKLKQHQVLQQDIESWSSFVTSVLKLSEHLDNTQQSNEGTAGNGAGEQCNSLMLVALKQQKRWHTIWLESLEWQCRLEDIFSHRKINKVEAQFDFSLLTNSKSNVEFECRTTGLEDESNLDLVHDYSVLQTGKHNFLQQDSNGKLDVKESLQHGFFRESNVIIDNVNLTKDLVSPNATVSDRSSGDSANISECESKMGDSFFSMRVGLCDSNVKIFIEKDKGFSNALSTQTPLESKDVGYSSENLSNDEMDSQQQQSWMGSRYAGNIEVACGRFSVAQPGSIHEDYYCMAHVETESNANDSMENPVRGDESLVGICHLSNCASANNDATFKNDDDGQTLDCGTDLMWQTQTEATCSSIDNEGGLPYSNVQSTSQVMPFSYPCVTTHDPLMVIEPSSSENSCDASSESSNECDGGHSSLQTVDITETLFSKKFSCNSAVEDRHTRSNQLFSRISKNRPRSMVSLHESKVSKFRSSWSSESAINSLSHGTESRHSSFQNVMLSETLPDCNAVSQDCYMSSDQHFSCFVKQILTSLSYNSLVNTKKSVSSTHIALLTSDEDSNWTFFSDSAEKLCYNEEAHGQMSDDYITAPLEDGLSDEEIYHSSSSFSENAWDDYQVVYSTASEDATNESLPWEPMNDLDFEDLLLNTPTNSKNKRHCAGKRISNYRKKPVSNGPGSDSDVEDFHSVLEDSELCLSKVNHSLTKKRCNCMGTGLASSEKYENILTTCKTNIVCMEEICLHLTEEDIGVSDVNRVYAISDCLLQQSIYSGHALAYPNNCLIQAAILMPKHPPQFFGNVVLKAVQKDLLIGWEKLHALAHHLHHVAKLLEKVDKVVSVAASTMADSEELFSGQDHLTSKSNMDSYIDSLMAKLSDLEKLCEELSLLYQEITVIAEGSNYVTIDSYMEQLNNIGMSAISCKDRLCSHLSNLELHRSMWFQYLDEKQELEQLFSDDYAHLCQLLCRGEDMTSLSESDLGAEIEVFKARLGEYDTKLSALQVMLDRLPPFLTESNQHVYRFASLANIREKISAVLRQSNIHSDHCDGSGQWEVVNGMLQAQLRGEAMSTSASPGSIPVQSCLCEDLPSATLSSNIRQSFPRGRRTFWLRLLSVHLAVVALIAGLAYVLDPSLLSDLSSFTLRVSTDLRHINGPLPF